VGCGGVGFDSAFTRFTMQEPRWQANKISEVCPACSSAAALAREGEWTVWSGGFQSTHRHFTGARHASASKGGAKHGAKAWRGPTAVGRSSEDRQRRNVGLGPLWTGSGQGNGQMPEKPLVIFNTFPVFRRPFDYTDAGWTPSAGRECICHTAAPRGTSERFQGGSRARLRNLREGGLRLEERAKSATHLRSRFPYAGEADGGNRRGHIEQLRESHLAMLGAAQQAAESGDMFIRQKARTSLEGRVQQIDFLLACVRARTLEAAHEGRTNLQQFSHVLEDAST